MLRYVDHLSGFAHVAACRTKNAEEVGMKLIQIISSSVIRETLQSDNGPEFVGDCIKMIKNFMITYTLLKVVHIILSHKVKLREGMLHLKKHCRSG